MLIAYYLGFTNRKRKYFEEKTMATLKKAVQPGGGRGQFGPSDRRPGGRPAAALATRLAPAPRLHYAADYKGTVRPGTPQYTNGQHAEK